MGKVLCVDDEHEVLVTMCRVLEGAGHTVSSAESAQEAVAKISNNAYDAVVTDWRLGDASGRAVVQAAKNNSTVPVVVVTAFVNEAYNAAEPFADLYLEKPVNPEELVIVVNELLKHRNGLPPTEP